MRDTVILTYVMHFMILLGTILRPSLLGTLSKVTFHVETTLPILSLSVRRWLDASADARQIPPFVSRAVGGDIRWCHFCWISGIATNVTYESCKHKVSVAQQYDDMSRPYAISASHIIW
jgi:uncharacterized membrane protein YhaH (DUF805 family)